MRILTLIIVMSLNTTLILTQDSNLDYSTKLWSISLNAAGTIGGPNKDIEYAMNGSGFNYRSPSLFGWGGSVHPISRTNQSSWVLNFRRSLKSPYSIIIIVGNSNLGITDGYNINAGSLSLQSSVFTYAPIISINSLDKIRIGIGPSLYTTKTWKSSGSNSEQQEVFSSTNVGALIDFGLILMNKSKIFLELSVQYRVVGKTEVGPFTAENFGSSAVLPNSSLNYNHLLVGIGIGIRF
jgi:hypothetical protein